MNMAIKERVARSLERQIILKEIIKEESVVESSIEIDSKQVIEWYREVRAKNDPIALREFIYNNISRVSVSNEKIIVSILVSNFTKNNKKPLYYQSTIDRDLVARNKYSEDDITFENTVYDEEEIYIN